MLFVSPLRTATGNATTALRLAASLRNHGHKVTLLDCEGCDVPTAVAAARDCGARLAVALHCVKAAPLALATGLPTVVVAGGTDLNQPGVDGTGGGDGDAKSRAVAASLRGASAVVAFSAAMRETALRIMAAAGAAGGDERAVAGSSHVRIIPQAVADPLPGLPRREEARSRMRAAFGLRRDAVVLLLPCGVRAVKAPTWAAPAIRAWHLDDPRVHLLVVGPVLEAKTAAALAHEIEHAEASNGGDVADGAGAADARSGAEDTGEADDGVGSGRRYLARHLLQVVGGPRTNGYAIGGPIGYHTPVPSEVLSVWMAGADVVVNTSESEGMCSAVLEAMAVRTPVVARDNAGNRSVISHESTGWLVRTPEALVAASRAIVDGDEAARATVVDAARARVEDAHSIGAEARAWLEVLDAVAAASER